MQKSKRKRFRIGRVINYISILTHFYISKWRSWPSSFLLFWVKS